MVYKNKKQAFTLLEIMIVICLIGLIGGVISYNMKGSLEEGKAFKTVRAKEQLHDILMLEAAKGYSLDEVVAEPLVFLKNSGLVKDPKKLLVDGWNNSFDIKVDQYGSDIVIKSEAHENFLKKKKGNLKGVSKKNPTDTGDSDDGSQD